MSRRLPAHVRWALGVLRAGGYRGSVERGPDGRVRSVRWSPAPQDEQHEGDDGEDDEDGPEHA